MVWHAAIPAVSVLSLLFPKLTEIKPFCCAFVTSCLEKSPSGPIKINEEQFFNLKSLRAFLFWSKQFAINLFFWECSIEVNSFKEIAGFNLGIYALADCLIAAIIILFKRSFLIVLRSDLWQIIGVISFTPISVAFSKNHSSRSMFFVGAIAIWV